MPIPFTLDYAPRTLREVLGQNLQLLKQVGENFVPGKMLLLSGPPGSGKTSAVHALANDIGADLIEINASDSRNKATLEQLLKNATGQMSLLASTKIILLDELDGLSGRKDRGAIPTVAKIVPKSRFLIIGTLEDASERKFRALRKVARVIDFNPVPAESVQQLLSTITKKESLNVSGEQLASIARRCGGDVRAALNDLVLLSQGGDVLDERDHTLDIAQALFRIFKTTDAKVARGAVENLPGDPDTLLLWIEENLPKEYLKPEDIAKGFDVLSKADVFIGRIRRRQYYRYYVYLYDLLSAGVALAKSEKYPSTREYQESKKILFRWMAKQKMAKRMSIAEKLAAATHTSIRRAFEDVIYLKVSPQPKVIEELDLTPEEKDWLKK